MKLLFLILLLPLASGAAETSKIDWLKFSNNQIADAIYKAEGGEKAKVPYGILSVKVKDEQDARKVCLNTIRNNRIRFAKQTKHNDFIEFLGSKYCPVSAHELNKNWVRNIKYFLLENEKCQKPV